MPDKVPYLFFYFAFKMLRLRQKSDTNLNSKLMKTRIYPFIFALLAVFCVQDTFAQGALDQNKQRPIDDAVIGGAVMRIAADQVVVDEIITDFDIEDDEVENFEGVDSSDDQNALTKFDLELFPNPAHTDVNIVFRERADYGVTVFDLTGKRIFNSFYPEENRISIDVSMFTQGMYIVQIQSENFNESRKLKVAR